MRTWMRLAAFAAGIAVLFAAAMGAGQAVDPASGPATSDHSGSNHSGSAHSGDAGHPGHGAPTSAGGLGVSQDGCTLVAESTTFTAGTASPFRFTITDRDGRPVTGLQPYLGALGHLVVLRQGDLGYLHVHPVDGLTFQAGAPVAGTYRMYLDFKHENRVRTAEFTARVRGGAT